MRNAADRDHCMQYMVAVALLKGNITSIDYEDSAAADPRIDDLRAKTACVENKQWTIDHDDPDKRSIANGVQVFFRDGTKTDAVTIEYPLGHRSRRQEALPLIREKFARNVSHVLAPARAEALISLLEDGERLDGMPVCAFMDTLAP